MTFFQLKSLLILFFGLITSINSNAQNTNLLNQDYYGFEKETNGWETNNNINWKSNSEKSATGNFSLKFSSLTEVNPLISFDTQKTILKVRVAKSNKNKFIVASSYEGTLLAVRFDGKILWENTLSGFMNHDIWCDDITGDGVDEIFVANANGTLFCLNSKGDELWQFKPSDAPMYSVCVASKNETPYVVCGGFDKNIYYLSSEGNLVQTLDASTYSENKVFSGITAPSNTHIANFIRTIKKSDGSEMLAVLGTNNSMQVTGNMYFIEVLGGLVGESVKIDSGKPVGEMRICDVDGDGTQEILMGTSSHVNDARVVRFDPFKTSNQQSNFKISSIRNKVGAPGYRISQPEIIKNDDELQYFVLHGPNILLVPQSMDLNEAEVLNSSYSFNDMWKDPTSGKIILASNQSGGSEIHILNTEIPTWKSAFVAISPKGKTQKVIENINKIESDLVSFNKPVWERNPISIYLMHENKTGVDPSLYNAPIFLPQPWMPKVQDGASWNRDAMTNEKYRDKRDKRRQYVLNETEVLNTIIPNFGEDGIAYWGGHGNDPYFYSVETTKKVIDAAAGKQMVLVYPEIQDDSEDFQFVMDDLMYPLATYGKGKNLKLFIRSKNVFWQGSVYLPYWHRLLSGEFSDVFVPSMEETTDKTMELSIAGRMGVWASGAVDSWGSRAVPDNTSFDRLRQISDQPLSNHFLRQLIYVAANGAQYFDNFTKPDLFAKLIASGVLYVPKRSEILSISPVHLSMLSPDEHYLEDGSELKWLTNFNQQFEDSNKFVFSRMNGSWPGAPINEWDFSSYAANTKERRLNFLPTYKNGMVLITPPQKGTFADKDAIRGKLTDYLHPFYKNIMKEYYTDGHHYYSSDGNQTYAADTYYKTIESDIKDSASKLPITVSGDVAWVVAQTSPTHLRLTIIDNGYINPDDRNASVSFNNIEPKKIVDLLDGKTFSPSNSMINVDIPSGAFRFLDIELTNPF